MKRLSTVLPFVLLAASAILIVLFYLQTRLMDLDRHDAAAQDLLRLKHLDTQLNEEILKAVSLQLSHFDSIVHTVSRMREINMRLHDSKNGLYGLISPKVDVDLDTYQSLLNEKLEMVETIKSRTAIMRNSISYLPLELSRITENRYGYETVEMLRLLNAMLIHNVSPTVINREDLNAAIERLRVLELSPQDRDDIDKVLLHVDANLKAQDDILSVVRDLLALPTTEKLDRIFQDHLAFSRGRIKATNVYRKTVLALSLLLFAGLAATLIKLRTARNNAEQMTRQFRDAAQSIDEGFAFFDANGHLSFWNGTFARLHNSISNELVKGVTFEDFFDACVSSGLYQTVEFDDKESSPDRLETHGSPYVVKSSNNTWMMASDSRMADGGTASVRVDITEAKHTEDELRKLSRAVEQSPASVMITDTAGHITYVNPKFLETTGYSADEIIGQKPNLINSGEKSNEEYGRLWSTISNGDEWRGEFHNRRKDGSLFWEYASISAIKNDKGEITHFIAVKEDITERKETMEALIKAKEQAELANHTKTQFLANMSHELRTPLNAIIGFSEIIKGQMFGPLGHENYIEYSGNILTSGRHLLDVINDILDVSRIETGNMDIHKGDVNVTELCKESYEMFREQADMSKLNFRISIDKTLPVIQGDAIRIKQIILNLLSNSIKFTPAQGTVDFSTYRDGDQLVISVRDTGHGIPQEQQSKILEPFEQVSDIYTRNHEGSGLGLYLVNSFVKLHDGTLIIDSTVDIGTTVTVRLPIGNTEEQHPPPQINV